MNVNSVPPRLSSQPFPPYRYIPGKNPHPKRSEDGYLYAHQEALQPTLITSENYQSHADYRFAIDLWNAGYDWHFHEVLEPIWKIMPRDCEDALYLQGMIQLAASRIKAVMAQYEAARDLRLEAKKKLKQLKNPYWGVNHQQIAAELADDPETDVIIQMIE